MIICALFSDFCNFVILYLVNLISLLLVFVFCFYRCVWDFCWNNENGSVIALFILAIIKMQTFENTILFCPFLVATQQRKEALVNRVVQEKQSVWLF